jgi:Domain of unknown function (DUF4136)
MRCAVLVVAALSFAACSRTKVTVNYDRSLDFTTFHTYSWARPSAAAELAAAHPEPTANSLVSKEIVAAVDAELRKKGLTRVDERGDLELRFHTSVSRGYDVVSYGHGPYRLGGSRNARVRAVGVGSLTLDLIDARKKELAWRAVASDELDPEISVEDRESHLAAVAEKMFRDFPPRR